jgi:SSS family solute:Na+ symporter/sodium/pantothenate symporter
MSATTFAMGLLTIYALATLGLSVMGMRKTTGLKSFALGKGDMSPVLVGITMAASIASTATFVINPGFVYMDGLSAWAHYGVGAMAGLICALLVLSRGFQKIGKQVSALTLPDWVRKHFKSRALGTLFAAMTLLYVSFIVLILSGSALILVGLFGMDYHWALVCLVVFCFSYVLLGGTYAHAYTNALQGVLMLGVALLVFFAGAKHLGSGFFDRLETAGAGLSAAFNPHSALYHDFFSVFGASFVITFALMLQPHILTKLLYLKEDKKKLNVFLGVSIAASLVFSLMLFVGFYARLDGLEIASLDKVVVTWIPHAFSPLLASFIFVTLLAAGMSTLDGILVAISTVVVQDLVLAHGKSDGALQKHGLNLSRLVLVALGLISLAIAWDPPKSLGLFAQEGVYGLVAASAVPMVVGILKPDFVRPTVVGGLALLSVVGHFVGRHIFDIANPGVTAGWAVIVGVGLGLLWAHLSQGMSGKLSEAVGAKAPLRRFQP